MADAVRGYASGKEAKTLCLNHNLAQSARFDVSAYGQDGALCMATTWCERLGFFHGMWLVQDDQDYVFTAGDAEGCSMSAAFTALVNRLPAKLRARATEIAKMVPKQ